jgi:hypothetical protein
MSVHDARTRSTLLGVGVVLATLGLAACAGSPAATPATCADESGDQSIQQMDTAGYRMVLAVGDREAMYTQDEVDANSPMSGELMVAGTMMDPGTSGASGGGMMSGANGGTRHVEVAICDLTTGSTVNGADVTMMVGVGGAVPQPMPVAEMRGLDEPTTQTHYGNNIPMGSGPFTVSFTVNRQTVSFTVEQ